MSDTTKPQLTLVPLVGLRRIARILEAGLKDGRDPGDWKNKKPEDFKNALLRHVADYTDPPYGTTLAEEDHLAALAANALILLHFEEGALRCGFPDEVQKLPRAADWQEGVDEHVLRGWYAYADSAQIDRENYHEACIWWNQQRLDKRAAK